MIVETTIAEQARPANTFPPTAAVELRANGGIAALLPDRPQARDADGNARRAEPARTMDGLEVPQ